MLSIQNFDVANIISAGSNGITISNAGNDGIALSGAMGRAGLFTNDASSVTPALYVGHGDNAKYDLQLNRTGRIAAEISLVVHLGTSGDGGQFIIKDDDDVTVATISQNGNADFTGNLTKGSGTFKIDHPLEPTKKYLYHSFVESPDMMNIYNGNVITRNDGFGIVELPDYFEALNMEFRYQLTVIGEFANAIVKEEIFNNQFVILTDKPNVKVSWQVTRVRQDPYANMNRVVPIVEKEPEAKGTYLHPAAWAMKLAEQ